MTVRPAYAGGVAEVLSAYKHAHGRLSLQRLVDYLAKLAYKYPYHQAIGFYLTRSGNYTREDLLLLSEIGMNFDFYLCHGIKRMRFDKTWRLHYPAELDT